MRVNVPYTCRAVRHDLSNGFESSSIRWRTYEHTLRVQAFIRLDWLQNWFGNRLKSRLTPAYKKTKRRQDSAHMKSTLRGLMFMVASADFGSLCLSVCLSVCLTVWLSSPTLALADDTPNPCNALKRIVEAAPGGFASLQPDD